MPIIEWVSLAVVASVAIRFLLMPKPPKPPVPKPGDFNPAAANAGEVIPVLLGRHLITGMNIVYWGSVTKAAVKSYKSPKPVIGYAYNALMHSVLFLRADSNQSSAVYRVDFNEKEGWAGTIQSGVATINAPNLYGGFDTSGPGGEGGVVGYMDFHDGDSAQNPRFYLGDGVGYRGVFSVWMYGWARNSRDFRTWGQGFHFGNSNYPKNMAFLCSNISSRLTGGYASINGDMNPAHMIYDALTSRSWGAGLPQSAIDIPSFQAAALQLFNESFGLSFYLNQQIEAGDFINEVKRHIDAEVFCDRTTGQYRIVLIRQIANPAGLPLIDGSIITKVGDFEKTNWHEITNSVTINYTNPTTFKADSITVQDGASAARTGSVLNKTEDYRGICNAALAGRVGERVLKSSGTQIAKIDINCTREAASLQIGDAFRLSLPRYGIAEMVMRVVEIDLGSFEKPDIRIKCVSDIFSIASASYMEAPPSSWDDGSADPSPMLYHLIQNANWFDLVNLLGLADAQLVPVDRELVLAAGVPNDGVTISSGLRSDAVDSYQEPRDGAVCGFATTDEAATKMQTVVLATQGSYFQTDTYAAWENEIVYVVSYGAGAVTLQRGCLDTAPAEHASGTRIYTLQNDYGSDLVQYANAATARIKLLPVTLRGELAEGDATAQNFTVALRHNRPYVAKNFRVDGSYFPTSAGSTLALTWAHGNRLNTDSMQPFTATTETMESGCTYVVDVRAQPSNTAVISAQATDTATTHSLDLSGVSWPGGTTGYRVELWTVRDDIRSWQAQSCEIEMP